MPESAPNRAPSRLRRIFPSKNVVIAALVGYSAITTAVALKLSEVLDIAEDNSVKLDQSIKNTDRAIMDLRSVKDGMSILLQQRAEVERRVLSVPCTDLQMQQIHDATLFAINNQSLIITSTRVFCDAHREYTCPDIDFSTLFPQLGHATSYCPVPADFQLLLRQHHQRHLCPLNRGRWLNYKTKKPSRKSKPKQKLKQP